MDSVHFDLKSEASRDILHFTVRSTDMLPHASNTIGVCIGARGMLFGIIIIKPRKERKIKVWSLKN